MNGSPDTVVTSPINETSESFNKGNVFLRLILLCICHLFHMLLSRMDLTFKSDVYFHPIGGKKNTQNFIIILTILQSLRKQIIKKLRQALCALNDKNTTEMPSAKITTEN